MKKLIALILSSVIILTPYSAFAQEVVFGVDVSTHNEIIDPVSLTESGKSFVMIRLGYSDKYVDDKFFDNVKAAYEGNIPFGVYLYSYAYNEDEAEKEAEFVINTLSEISEYLDLFNLPVAYDLEEEKILQNASKAEINKIMTTFCDSISNAGYTPMVYANRYWFSNYIDSSLVKAKGYKTWYAYYPGGEPDFSSNVEIGETGLSADIWQYKKGDYKLKTLDENVMFNPSEIVKPITCVHKLKRLVEPSSAGKDGSVILKCEKCGSTVQKTVIPAISSVELNTNEFTYNGKAKRPAVTVKDKSLNVIASGNYSVSYSKNINVGYATATVSFKGNYKGTKKLTFKIIPKGTSLSKLTPKSKALKAVWKKQPTQITGYEIQYSLNSAFKKGNKTLTVKGAKTTSKTVKKLKDNKKYYVRIRTYKTVNGKKLCSKWSKAKSVKLK